MHRAAVVGRRVPRVSPGLGGGGGVGALAITWELPTFNEDGTPIGTITAQTAHFDTVSRMGSGVDYAFSQAVGDGTSTSTSIVGLTPGVDYFWAMTVTAGGVESNYGIESSGTAS